MADRRAIQRAPFDTPEHRAARGPNGRRLCRWCGHEVPKGRILWCSQACVDEFVVRKGDGRAAKLVFERDKGVCALCGLDCGALEEIDDAARSRVLVLAGGPDRAEKRLHSGHARALAAVLRRAGFNQGQRPWQVDHIAPVVEGGGACGLENLRTLCTPCHKRVTADLAARRALRRRETAEERSNLLPLCGAERPP